MCRNRASFPNPDKRIVWFPIWGSWWPRRVGKRSDRHCFRVCAVRQSRGPQRETHVMKSPKAEGCRGDLAAFSSSPRPSCSSFPTSNAFVPIPLIQSPFSHRYSLQLLSSFERAKAEPWNSITTGLKYRLSAIDTTSSILRQFWCVQLSNHRERLTYHTLTDCVRHRSGCAHHVVASSLLDIVITNARHIR